MSNRLTFSLASLIFLIALGLVFAPTSVMAHDGTAGNLNHAHPLTETLPAVDLNGNNTPGETTVPGEAEVTPHGAHPLVTSIALKPHASLATTDVRNVVLLNSAGDAILGLADGDGAGTFTVVVTFSGTLEDTGVGSELADGEVTLRSRRSSNGAVLGATLTHTVAAVTDEPNMFEVTITVPEDAWSTDDANGDGTSDDFGLLLPIEIFVDISAGAVASASSIDSNGVTLNSANSYAKMSDSMTKFTVVEALSPNQRPTLTVDTTTPTEAVTDGTFDIEYTATDADDDTVTIAATPTVVPSGAMTHYTLDTSVAGTVTVNQAMPSATLMEVPAASVTVTITPSDAGGAGDAETFTVFFAARTYTPENQRPTADISTTAPTTGVTTGSFDIMYTTADADNDTVTVEATHAVVPSGAMAHYTLDTSVAGTVTVNQATADAATPMIEAATVTVTITPSDAGGAGTAATLAVPFAADMYTPATDTLAAGKYQVLVGPNFNAATLPGVATVTHTGTDFPDDLATFLIAGGTIDVVATGGDVIINELMVARDAFKLGALPGDPTDGQWIELYNKHETETATGITVSFSSDRPAPAAPANLQDRLSNVVDRGWAFPGDLGDAVLNGSSNPQGRVPFRSIRRTNHGDGWNKGHWGTAVPSLLFATGRVGTPGGDNTVEAFTPAPNTKPKRSSIIISEVANRIGTGKDWIELKGPANTTLRKWRLSIATAVGTETTLYQFADNDNIRISSNGHLLLTKANPLQSELEAEYDNGAHAPKRYVILPTLGELPNTGDFVLILRNAGDKSKPDSIEDIAGYADLSHDDPYTKLWPLTGDVGAVNDKNRLNAGRVYRRIREGIDGYSQAANANEQAFAPIGFTGLGYDRNAPATDENGGTPGYPHGNWKHNGASAKGEVIISEIMYATGNGGPTRNRNLPQWIEIHNTSDVNSVNLGDWRLEIINSERNDADGTHYTGKLYEEVKLSGMLPPNQTYLIVEHVASSFTRLPSERVKIVGKKFNEDLLNAYGFHLTLRANYDRPAAEHVIVDTAGNLKDPTDTRRGNDRAFAGNAWEFETAIAEDNSRISISRKIQVPPGRASFAADGTMKYGWVLTDMDKRYSGLIRLTYYGRTDDRATPGYTIGAALPVSLSTFRPQRLDDGSVVIRWITESELDNAGFNILRSETRDGQFTKLNTQLIAGQGTTSERTTYEWKDTTAKPNVVYYYQIQDVSLDGDIATLRTTRLRGHVSPSGKATTTWGQLKSLQ